MIRRKSLVSSIMAILSARVPFTSPALDIESTPEHFSKPQVKTKFKQNQRKERKSSARKKAKR